MSRIRPFDGFSLIEITLAMIIMAVVSGGVVFVWQGAQNSFSQWFNFQSTYLDEQSALNQFQMDVFQAELVQKEGDNLVLSGNKIVVYNLGPELVRNASDTMLKQCSNWEVEFEDSTSIVSGIYFELGTNPPTRFSIRKRYAYNQIQLGHANSN